MKNNNKEEINSVLVKAFGAKKFHDNPDVDYKIKVMFLWFDNKVYKMKLDYKHRIKLYNLFIHKFIRFEEYEMAIAFKERKWRVQKEWRTSTRDLTPYLIFRLHKRKLRKFFLKLFTS
jgi:hypothetical protein